MDPQHIAQVAIIAFVLLLSLTVHEYFHARAAYMLGDRTAEFAGRLTLNPIAHIDPIGTVLFPLIGLLSGLPVIGWAKPVPVNPLLFSRRVRMKTGMLIVAAAGPLSNLGLALLSTGIAWVWLNFVATSVGVDTTMFVNISLLFQYMIGINVLLAFFNLLPIPPLDGSKILYGILPDEWGARIEQFSRYAFLILIVLLFTGGLRILLYPALVIMNFLISAAGFVG